MSEDRKPERRKPDRVIIFGSVACIPVVVIWLLFHIGFWNGGDSAAEALFTGLAFAGVLVALRLQSHELALQRQELAQTRDELKGQKEQLEAQDKTMRLQAAESTFFQLLQAFRSIATTISDPVVGGVSGPHYWRSVANMIDSGIPKGQDINVQIKAYEQRYAGLCNSLGPYFANLAELLIFLYSSTVLTSPHYSRLVRAQLSSIEVLLIGFHGLSLHGRSLKPLIERFGLLKYIQQPPNVGALQIPSAYNADAMADPH